MIIKFKGKIIDNPKLKQFENNGRKGWLYGDGFCRQPIFDEDGCGYLIPDNQSGEWLPVIPESVGQFTGYKDNEGTLVYSGDIILVEDHYSGDIHCSKSEYLVTFDDAEFYALNNSDNYLPLSDALRNFNGIVVGNFYDNKD
jgi:hypothetical protein